MSVLVVALAVFAWQQGDDGDGDGPLNAIAQAAERTQREPGGHATMRAIVTSPTRSFTIRGQIAYDDEADRSQAVMTFPDPDSGDVMEMQVITDESVMYMRSSMFGSLPGGREWMALDFSFAQEPETPLPASGDAKGELELLEEVTDVHKLGREDVHGVPTTRYRGALDSDIEEGTPLRLEAWVDADERVRRMRIVSSQPGEGGEGPETVDMRMDFFDFGSVPEINPPEPSEVFDATALAEHKFGLSNDE